MKVKMKHLDKVNHQIIRYANVWEDADLLISGLDIKPVHKVLSIASGGDNSFATLVKDPNLVIAVDINDSQLYLTELKREAIKLLNREKFLEFIGFREFPGQERSKIFKEISAHLSNDARHYWEKNQSIIQNGIVYSGKFERYLKLFAEKILPFIHSEEIVNQFFVPKRQSDQEAFYIGRWDTWKWRMFFRIFFSKFIMGRLGRDPQFLNEVKVDVGQSILEKAKQHLSSEFVSENWILHYCLKGNFDDQLPFYVRAENYDLIRENIDLLIIEKGYAQDVATKYGKFDRFNLSNIFEYMKADYFRDTATELGEIARPEAKFAYWNLLVPRSMENMNSHFQRINANEKRDKDKGFFYNDFIIDDYVY